MKKVIKKVSAFLLTAILVLLVTAPDAYASSSVSIAGGDAVEGGEVFSVSVTFDGDDIGRVVGHITYDTEMISYISGGSSSGNVGYVELKTAGTGEPLTFDLKFQAIKEGSTELSVYASEMYDLAESYMDTPSGSKTVVISGNAEEEEVIEETTEPDTAAEENLSVDEKVETEETEMVEVTESVVDVTESTVEETESVEENGSLARTLMFSIGGLILLLIIVMIFRRKR